MQAKLFVCSHSSALDSRRNSISIFNIIEEVHVPAYPIVFPEMAIVALLELDEGEPIDAAVEVRVFINEQQLFAAPIETNFQVRRKARVLAQFNGLVVPAPGILRILLHSAGHDFVSWQVPCDQTAPPQLELQIPTAEQPPAQQGQ